MGVCGSGRALVCGQIFWHDLLAGWLDWCHAVCLCVCAWMLFGLFVFVACWGGPHDGATCFGRSVADVAGSSPCWRLVLCRRCHARLSCALLCVGFDVMCAGSRGVSDALLRQVVLLAWIGG